MYKNKLILLVLVIFSFQSLKSQKFQNSEDILKLVDLFISEEKVPKDHIIVIRISTFPNEINYLTVIYDFNPTMYLGFNNFDTHFGQYLYKNYQLSYMAENGIDITPILKNKKLKKISDLSYTNENGIICEYDPASLHILVDNNFYYKKSFHNWSGKKALDEKLKMCLESVK